MGGFAATRRSGKARWLGAAAALVALLAALLVVAATLDLEIPGIGPLDLARLGLGDGAERGDESATPVPVDGEEPGGMAADDATSDDATADGGTVDGEEAVGAAPATPVDATEAVQTDPAAAELSEELVAAMEAWIPTYLDLFGRLSTQIEEIDFNGFGDPECEALSAIQNRLRATREPAPDDSIRALLSDALGAFDRAAAACHERDPALWSKQVLAAKAGTHEAQELMRERYGFDGILDLELESANGETRSRRSMTGRHLAQQELLDF